MRASRKVARAEEDIQPLAGHDDPEQDDQTSK
jgi:hypothetical protein